MTPSFSPSIILAQTQLAANIGSTARAMLNFGLTDLRLVAPLEDPLSQPARSMAAGADALLETAKIYPSLKEAIEDLRIVYATTARPRDITKFVTTPEAGCKELVEYARNNIRTGILFGREKSGLTNEDLSWVEKIIEIPVNPEFSSLNLSQAVIVIAYELYQAFHAAPMPVLRHNDSYPAKRADLINFFERLEKELDDNGFLSVPGKRDIMVRNIRNIFNRTELTDQELRTLHGIVSSLISYSSAPKK